MAFPIPDHLPRRSAGDTQDLASDILKEMGGVTHKTLTSGLAASWVAQLDSAVESTKVRASYFTLTLTEKAWLISFVVDLDT